MSSNKNNMIKEEQRILDDLIRRMDRALRRLKKGYLIANREHDRAKGRPLSDSYMDLIRVADDKIKIKNSEERLYRARSELYDTRIIVDIVDDKGYEEKELKIGLHTYLEKDKIFICSWKLPVCRHYLLDNGAIDYHSVVNKNGTIFHAYYSLKLKRKIKLSFDKVQDVTQMYPVDEIEEEILADEFLKTLLERRTEKEFQNIVFSIQRKQGEIIGAPYNENMIVQGCAGSGKSMIMLHRLPILLFDNPNILQRNRLYIITPSEAYIQMADNMRSELEISDLNMGTMNQYYNTLLSRYSFKMDDRIGKIDYRAKLSPDQISYIYSDDCLEDIHSRILELIDVYNTDFSSEISSLRDTTSSAQTKTIKYKTNNDKVRQIFISLEDLINKNHSVMKQHCDAIYTCIHKLFILNTLLDDRKSKIIDRIRSSIYNEEEIIKKRRKKIQELDPKKNVLAIEHREKNITEHINKIKQMEFDLHGMDSFYASIYFENIEAIKKETSKVADKYSNLRLSYSNDELSQNYNLIEDKQWIVDIANNIQKIVLGMDDLYTSYVEGISTNFEAVKLSVQSMKRIHTRYLPKQKMLRLMGIRNYYQDLNSNLVIYVHNHILQKVGRNIVKSTRKCRPIEMSPYILCRILLDYAGVPNAAGESLITIDEAQNLAVNELKLIKEINKNGVVFNLFGDVKQHIEGTKGVDNWNDFSGIVSFKNYYLEENYRNARQITDYCNNRFHLNMIAINVDGNGVHEITDISKFRHTLQNLFHSADHSGLSAIIVKDQEEAETIKVENSESSYRINDLTDSESMLSHSKWNLLTIKQAKGLEFNTVIALSGRMTQNEKYICYTRALDELYIYDGSIDIIGNKNNSEHIDDSNINESDKKHGTDPKVKKPRVYGNEVEKFFLDKGLEVINTRKKDGYLRVIGDEEQIGEYVNEAISKFGISGQYGKSKATKLREAWATKTRK